MRSVEAPRVRHDATVELGSGVRARSVNLSTGGIFIATETPPAAGERLELKVNLRDGEAPIDAAGEVVRSEESGVAVRFTRLDESKRVRIQKLVQRRDPTLFRKRDVRIHLPSLGTPLRATARDLSEQGVMIEAELPWLRLGSQVTAELSPDRACEGRVRWIGIDVTPAGAARLRISLDLNEDTTHDVVEPGRAALGVEEEPQFPMLALAEVGRSRLRWIWPAATAASLTALLVVSLLALRRPASAQMSLATALEPGPAALRTSTPSLDATPVRARAGLGAGVASATTNMGVASAANGAGSSAAGATAGSAATGGASSAASSSIAGTPTGTAASANGASSRSANDAAANAANGAAFGAARGAETAGGSSGAAVAAAVRSEVGSHPNETEASAKVAANVKHGASAKARSGAKGGSAKSGSGSADGDAIAKGDGSLGDAAAKGENNVKEGSAKAADANAKSDGSGAKSASNAGGSHAHAVTHKARPKKHSRATRQAG